MIYGLVSTGYNVKRLPTIKYDLENAFKESFGDIDVSPSSTFGQIIGIMSRFLAELWEQSGNLYQSRSPISASGVSLDSLVALNLLTRLSTTSTKVYVQFTGDEDTVIGSGFSATSTLNNEQFTLETGITISRQSINRVIVQIETTDNQVFAITLNGYKVAVTANGNTVSEIANLFVTAITVYYNHLATATLLSNGAFRIDSLTQDTPLSFDIRPDCISDISITTLYTPGILYSNNTGRILAVSNTVTTINTPVSGLDSITNFYDGELGRAIEEDDELRLRRERSFKIVGTANMEAIAARLISEVPNVTAVIPYENTTDTTVNSMPPHSGEFVVVGGGDQEIANKLWQLKPCGIQLIGNANNSNGFTVVDSQGNSQIIKFSRPVTRYAHIRVTILSYYNEELFPDNGAIIIKEEVVAFLNNLTIGNDIILQRIMGPIYTKVPGIATMSIEGALTSSPLITPTFVSTNLVINAAEVADFDTTRVTVILP